MINASPAQSASTMTASQIEATMSESPLRIEYSGRVARLTLNRPDQLNALNSTLVESLRTALEAISKDDEIGAVVLAGDGRAFCAGADLTELVGFEPSEFDRYIRELEGVCCQLERLPQPTVAAIHGVAFGGGCELALACDLRMADPKARFGLPEIKLGLLPGAGGMQRAARLLPLGIVRKLSLTGEPLDAVDAQRHGFTELSDAGACTEASLELAGSLANGARLAQSAAKRLLRLGAALDVEAAIEFEQGSVTALFATADRDEGIRAFLEKRPPKFAGR
jgi:enoyl-CoA hydratase/carnithine racemase